MVGEYKSNYILPQPRLASSRSVWIIVQAFYQFHMEGLFSLPLVSGNVGFAFYFPYLQNESSGDISKECHSLKCILLPLAFLIINGHGFPLIMPLGKVST